MCQSTEVVNLVCFCLVIYIAGILGCWIISSLLLIGFLGVTVESQFETYDVISGK